MALSLVDSSSAAAFGKHACRSDTCHGRSEVVVLTARPLYHLGKSFVKMNASEDCQTYKTIRSSIEVRWFEPRSILSQRKLYLCINPKQLPWPAGQRAAQKQSLSRAGFRRGKIEIFLGMTVSTGLIVPLSLLDLALLAANLLRERSLFEGSPLRSMPSQQVVSGFSARGATPPHKAHDQLYGRMG